MSAYSATTGREMGLLDEIAKGHQLRPTRTVVRRFGFVEDTAPDLQLAEVLPNFLFLGSQDVAHRADLLRGGCITHVLNVGSGIENLYPEDFDYCSVEVLDLPETNLRPALEQALSFIDEGREKRGRVFVHCNAGVSRSVSVVMAYLIRQGSSYAEAYALVKAARPAARPNDGFVRQLQDYARESAKSGC